MPVSSGDADPSSIDPSYILTVLFASAVPVNVNDPFLLSSTDAITSIGATVSSSNVSDAVPVLYASISVNSPSNWNGSNIINGDASQTWSTTHLYFYNVSFPSLPVTYDLTSNTFSHVTIYTGSNNVTFQINSANTAGVQSFGAGGTNDKLVTAEKQ
jgi:hypothetical protein